MYTGPTLRAWSAHPRRPGRRLAVGCALLLAAMAVMIGAGCGGSQATDSAGSSSITVFGAASLTDAFTRLGADFTAAHPGAKVKFNFAGSQDLVAQLEQGAPDDVLATADPATMDKVAALVGTSQVFAGNRLAIAVAPGNPARITSLQDLANPKLKVVMAAPQVPAGKYSQQLLVKAGVTVKPVSLEDSVKGVVTKVSLGEADAGIVYVTDISAAAGKVEGIDIPNAANIIATYPIAVVKATRSTQDAQAFVDLVMSGQGQAVLKSFGFLPPGGP
jgi:molybdate transport system substrate-binding protein